MRELPPLERTRLDRFVELGLVREGPQGHYYLFEAATLANEIVMEAVPFSGPRMLKTLVFWLVALAVPLGLIALLD